MARFIVTDAAGVERTVTRPLVVDSGGTTRAIRRGFVIDAGGTARQFWQLSSQITVGNNNPRFGYSSAANGSIDPDPTLIAGEALNAAESDPTANEFRIQIAGNAGGVSSFFTSVFVEDNTGTIRQFDTADASFQSAPSLWTWSTVSDVWHGGDVLSVFDISFIV